MPPTATPSTDDAFVRGASERAGGPLGRHAHRAGRWALPVVLALTLLTCLAGWAQKYPCRDPGNWQHEHQYTWMCYTDVVALYNAEGLADRKVPYRDHPVEYPVVIGGLMELASLGAHAAPADDRYQTFFDLTAIGLTVCALAVAATTVWLAGRRRPWDAAMVAVAPVLLLHAFTNWDLAATALAGLGLWAWSRDRPALAGVALGLGVATKLYPLLLIGALFLLCARAGRWRPFGRMFAAAAVAWLVVDLPVWAAWPTAFGRFYALNRTRPADWDSIWYLIEQVRGAALDSGPGAPGLLNALTALTLAVALAAIAALVVTAPRRPRVAQVAFLVVVAFLVTSKVWSPQYGIWLLPLAVLARPRWPAFLAWQASEVVLLFTRFYFFVGRDVAGQGLPQWTFLTAVAVRDLTLLVIAALVVREVWWPEHDVVRRDGVDDPAGGPLAGAPDALTLGRAGVPARA